MQFKTVICTNTTWTQLEYYFLYILTPSTSFSRRTCGKTLTQSHHLLMPCKQSPPTRFYNLSTRSNHTQASPNSLSRYDWVCDICKQSRYIHTPALALFLPISPFVTCHDTNSFFLSHTFFHGHGNDETLVSTCLSWNLWLLYKPHVHSMHAHQQHLIIFFLFFLLLTYE